jgi:hypothetical protein
LGSQIASWILTYWIRDGGIGIDFRFLPRTDERLRVLGCQQRTSAADLVVRSDPGSIGPGIFKSSRSKGNLGTRKAGRPIWATKFKYARATGGSPVFIQKIVGVGKIKMPLNTSAS